MSDSPSQMIAAVEQRLGAKAVVTDPKEIEPWLTDWRGRVHGQAPRDPRPEIDRRGR